MSRQSDELAQLWSLVGELTEQLALNQSHVKQLKDRLDNVKGQAAHAGAGFPLRRFNLDISDEEFQTELERFASHLVLENQSLQHENKQLNALLKEYETTLESVMGKFRGVAHDLSLHSYYSSLLQTLQTAHSSAHLHDNTSLSLLLTRLSTLLRSALRSLGGEEPEIDLSSLLSLSIPNGTGQSDDSGPSSPKSVSSGKKSIQKPPNRATPFPGFVPGTRGGYSGTEGQGDWALEREMEILRLEEENESLRHLLAIAEESPAAHAVTGDMKVEEDDKAGDESPAPSGMGRRKSSLTVEELEAGAEAEREEMERAVEAGMIDESGKSLVSAPDQFDIDDDDDEVTVEHVGSGSGTGLGGGLGPKEKQKINESLLGIRSEVENEAMEHGSAIEDDSEAAETGGSVESSEVSAEARDASAEEDGAEKQVSSNEEISNEESDTGGERDASTTLVEEKPVSEDEEGLAL